MTGTEERTEYVKSKTAMQNRIAERRAEGWNIITFGYTLTELERGNEILIIKRERRG